MAFTIEDFQDLIQLLEQRPEWRAELRRQVLADGLLALPAALGQLAEAQAGTEARLAALTERVDALAEAQGRTEARLAALTERVDALAEAQARTEARLAALTERVDALALRVETVADTVSQLAVRIADLATQVGTLATQVGTLGGHVGWLMGEVLEIRYERRYPSYFGRLARRLRLVDKSRLANLLDDAVEQQRLTEADQDAVLEADLVLAGRRPEGGDPVYLVVEVSVGIGREDVSRALDRAHILARLGQPAVPVVAGQWINPDAVDMAQGTGVWQVLNGRPIPPKQGR